MTANTGYELLATNDAAAHELEWVTDRAATATEPGVRHEECAVCGYARAAVEVPATGETNNPDSGSDSDFGPDHGSNPDPDHGSAETERPNGAEKNERLPNAGEPASFSTALLAAMGAVLVAAAVLRRRGEA